MGQVSELMADTYMIQYRTKNVNVDDFSKRKETNVDLNTKQI